jgi:hypothetical protein
MLACYVLARINEDSSQSFRSTFGVTQQNTEENTRKSIFTLMVHSLQDVWGPKRGPPG